jgi:hypothetical protein
MTRAFLAALAILVVGDAVCMAALKLSQAPGALAMAIWGVPVVAAFATSCLAPNRKFLVGLAVALPAAVMVGISNYVFEAMGNPVDFPGFKGSALVAGMSFPLLVVLCGVGALAGHFTSRAWTNA